MSLVVTVHPSDESANKSPDLVVIFLHGFNMTASEMAEEFVDLFRRFPRVRFVLPEAPRMCITAHGGEEGNAWFDYITDRGGSREDMIGLCSLRNERLRLLNLVAFERRKCGDGVPVLLGGLSQGGCMALDIATRVNDLAGVASCVSHRLSISKARPLLCPWYALTAKNDDVFPPSWSFPKPGETEMHLVVDSDHYLSRGEGPEFVGRAIEHILHKKNQNSLS
jgi:predicted esterase